MNSAPAKTRAIVVLIEDDPRVALVETTILVGAGFVVTWAATATEGLRLIRELRPAAVVLDGGLPDLDGFEVCRQLKADARTRDLPVVMCSAMTDAQERAQQAGADDFLSKFDDLARLGELVVQAILKRSCHNEPA